jgi:hypothetical protein
MYTASKKQKNTSNLTTNYNTNYCRVCGNEFSEKRATLGYETCLLHGETEREFTVAPAYNKGAYQVISRQNVKDIGR